MREPLDLPLQAPTTRPRAHDGEDAGSYILDVTAAAALLGRSENTVRRLIRAGDLPARQVRGARSLEYRLREADVLTHSPTHSPAHSPTHSPTHSPAQDHVSVSSADESQPAMSPVSAAAAGVAGVQALIEQATAPLVEANRRLTDQLMRQAEELGRLRERLDTGTVDDDARPREGPQPAAVSDAPDSDDGSALWGTIAARVRPAPAGTPAPPDPALRRSLIQRLRRR